MSANGIRECHAERKAHRRSRHGGFVDGAGWEGFYSILRKDDGFLFLDKAKLLSFDMVVSHLVMTVRNAQ